MSRNAVLRAPAHQVNSRARWYWGARAAAVWVMILAVEIVIAFRSHGNRTPIFITILVTLGIGGSHVLVMPQWRYRVHRWEATETAVYTQSGWFNQQRRIAPLSRIQTVDTERGPIEQLFRLSNVTVTTASAAGPLRIHGLSRADADNLAESLTHQTATDLGDAT